MGHDLSQIICSRAQNFLAVKGCLKTSALLFEHAISTSIIYLWPHLFWRQTYSFFLYQRFTMGYYNFERRRVDLFFHYIYCICANSSKSRAEVFKQPLTARKLCELFFLFGAKPTASSYTRLAMGLNNF